VIDQHLSLRWVPLDVAELHGFEKRVIAELQPLLNSTHNPLAVAELAALREACRTVARSTTVKTT
jgi:hypothetical protein